MSALDVASAIRSIGSFLIQEGSSLYGVEDDVRGLQAELEFIQQYLQDADSKQEERAVCALVRQVKKLAYDAEDVIDTYILKVHLGNGKNRFLRSAYLVYKFPHIYEVRGQIQLLQTSLQQVRDKLNNLGVIANSERGHLSHADVFRGQRPRNYSHDDNVGNFVVGMEDDIQKLVDMAMGEGRTQVGVISIVGMGGSGKTTLARKLYNHPYAKECFDCTAWVFVSQERSTQHILSEILRKVDGLNQTAVTLSVEELVDKIRRILEKKSYLVVLDDVWRKEDLEDLLPALPRGENNGSKIIITTRNREIIKFHTINRDQLYFHEPQPLTEQSSWELFYKIVLSHRNNYDEDSFKILGKDMLRKCDGLPLAIIALAGILNTRGTIGEWQQVAETVKSRILEESCGNMYRRVGDLLLMSYDDLPYDLKPCFLHLSLFPEDHIISVGMLIRMWIAEGIISTRYADMSLEDVALQRVKDLSHRFMIQVVKTKFNGAIKAIRLHDLLRDLSVQKAKEQSFLQTYTPFSSHSSTLKVQPRRAALHSSTALPTHISYLRSLILLTQASISQPSYNCTETFDLQIVSRNFKLLRELSIWGIKMISCVLPKHIGHLIHLRYLALRFTNITALPSSMGSLINLQTLDYRDIIVENDLVIENIKIKIPDVFQKLVLLRHLFLPVEFPWSVQELSLSSLRNLRTLWGVRLNSDCYFLREAPKLSNTLKKLKLVVSSENELKAAFCCPSLVNDVLQTFHCELRDGLVLFDVMPLRAWQHMLKLKLIGQISTELSLVLPVNLVKLLLKDSVIKDADPMNALGELAHLKQLSLSNAYEGTTLSCESGSFPRLEELIVDRLRQMNTWDIKQGAMPCLKKLEITNCWKLQYYPLGLNLVITLEKLEFFDMPNAFRIQAAEFGWAPQILRLPHNFTSIVKHSDSPVDSSSISKLYEQLTEGIFLDNKRMKYWVTKQHGSYVNSFMVYALGLYGYSKDRQFEKLSMNNCPDYEFREEIESQEVVMVAKLKSREFPNWQCVDGMFELENLSVEVAYEIYWLIMFERSLYGKKKIREHFFQTSISVGTSLDRVRTSLVPQLNEWISIPGGEIKTDATMEGQVQLSLRRDFACKEFDVIVKGFIIQPKPETALI